MQRAFVLFVCVYLATGPLQTGVCNWRGNLGSSINNKGHIECNTHQSWKKAEYLNCKQNVSVTEKIGMLSLLPFFCNMWQSWKSQCGEILSWRIFNLFLGKKAVSILLSLMATECKSCIQIEEIAFGMDFSSLAPSTRMFFCPPVKKKQCRLATILFITLVDILSIWDSRMPKVPIGQCKDRKSDPNT